MSKKDLSEPKMLELRLEGDLPAGGKISFSTISMGKNFSTGSRGFNFSGKMVNPESGEKYQITANVILIGSKPEKK